MVSPYDSKSAWLDKNMHTAFKQTSEEGRATYAYCKKIQISYISFLDDTGSLVLLLKSNVWNLSKP